MLASTGNLTLAVQHENARRLALVASRQSLDIDARRLYVKTWAGLLQLQVATGEKQVSEDELMRRYLGDFNSIHAEDEQAIEP